MSPRRFMVTLVAGTAIVFAAPVALAESPTGAPSDRPELAAHGSTPPAAAPGPEPQAGAPRPDPSAAPSPDPPERLTTPPAPTQSPLPTAAPEHPPEPITAPVLELSPQPGTGPAPEPPPQPGTAPAPDPRPQPGAGPKPEPPPEDPTVLTPKAAEQPPAGPSPPPGNGQAGCFLTSAGLICPDNPDCVITSSGVNCASGCMVTSAGLLCPRGGEVLPTSPVSGGRDETRARRPTPVGQVKAERKAKAERNVSPTTISRGEEPTAQDLPFTGAPMPAWLVLGFALLAGGLLLRRRISIPRTALELSSDVKPLAVLPGRPPRAGRLPSRRALVLPSLGLVACGMLLIRRMRR